MFHHLIDDDGDADDEDMNDKDKTLKKKKRKRKAISFVDDLYDVEDDIYRKVKRNSNIERRKHQNL